MHCCHRKHYWKGHKKTSVSSPAKKKKKWSTPIEVLFLCNDCTFNLNRNFNLGTKIYYYIIFLSGATFKSRFLKVADTVMLWLLNVAPFTKILKLSLCSLDKYSITYLPSCKLSQCTYQDLNSKFVNTNYQPYPLFLHDEQKRLISSISERSFTILFLSIIFQKIYEFQCQRKLQNIFQYLGFFLQIFYLTLFALLIAALSCMQ